MRVLEYYVGGSLHRLRLRSASRMAAPVPASGEKSGPPGRLLAELQGKARVQAVTAIPDEQPGSSLAATNRTGTQAVVPTESVAVDGSRVAEMTWARKRFGLVVVREGRQGKVLLQAPPDGPDPLGLAAQASRELVERGKVGAAHPNFLRVVTRPATSVVSVNDQWALDNRGRPGVTGADVHALAAWTVTIGSPSVRVAILDEGVDSGHPLLKDAVVAELDVVDGHPHARPDGNDAHGTACAGIVAAQGDDLRGLAPGCRLVAARIAKSGSDDTWIFDDFDTADAIDWAWDDAAADVLSNSWGGGPPVDVIIRAFARARTKGRKGKGSVVVVAAGNEQAPVGFPGNLQGILTVGASNQWDERKTKASKDGEDWWGSNSGPSLDLLAPGVAIRTTDIAGGKGYARGDVTNRFNGTSSATPFVAAACGLVLSVNGALGEAKVREIVAHSADRLTGGTKHSNLVGWGRLNAYAAVRAARRG
jgi:thermitase